MSIRIASTFSATLSTLSRSARVIFRSTYSATSPGSRLLGLPIPTPILTIAGAPVPFPTPEALDRLMAHDWPGNARELENVIQRALLLRRGERILASDLVIDGAAPSPGTLEQAARTAEFHVIRAALAEVDGHRARAAERLGISERTLRYRLAEMRAAAA